MKTGYTLPVFAIASAKAAIGCLLGDKPSSVALDLLDSGQAEIPIEQYAIINKNSSLAISISDPGSNLDITSGTPVWAFVQLETKSNSSDFILEGGEGIGKKITGEPAIYQFTYRLAEKNLSPLIPQNTTARIRFILPKGRELGDRTSNAAFGILDGLSLLGTSAISSPLSVEEKLAEFRAELRSKAVSVTNIAFYIGANSYQVGLKMGFRDDQLVQTANWIGVMLLEAALLGIQTITLIGYHGKLLKLAGGIFNTSSHITDGRIDILVRCAVRNKLQIDMIEYLEQLATADAVYGYLKSQNYDRIIFQDITDRISVKSVDYIFKYTDRKVVVNTFLCDRLGKLVLNNFNGKNDEPA